jgi:hypothetical protein
MTHEIKKKRGCGFPSALSLFIGLILIPHLIDAFSYTNTFGSPRTPTPDFTRTQKSLYQWQTKSALFSSVNGANSNSILNGGKTLSSQQILHADIYLSDLQPPPLEKDPIPLFTAIQSIIKALQLLMDASSAYKHNEGMTDDQFSLLTHLDTTSTLRIEETISSNHIIDPLCWLHAQQPHTTRLRHLLKDVPLPVLYFGDAEGQVEAAVVGKASNSFSDSWDPFVGKRIWDDEVGHDDEQRHHSMLKESDLPIGARIYGGSRFDNEFYRDKVKQRSRNAVESDDWDGFGGDRGGYWILPAVELRREVTDVSTTEQTSTDSSSEYGARKLTLAVHIHNHAKTGPSDFKHRTGWYEAAQRTLAILQELSDSISPAVPCTTLPPVITRSESVGKGENGDGDGQYVFERGVTEALRRIKNRDNVDASDQTSLRKVVLARKVDLNLGASVSGLDVLMRLKFGGHIGHIFYLNPGNDETASSSPYTAGMICSREFLGCAPERLFRVKRQGGVRTVRM